MWRGVELILGPLEPGQFDLTVLCGKLMIGVVPTGALLLATPFYFKTVVRNPRRVRSGPLLLAKLSLGSILLCAQLANVLLWYKAGIFPSELELSASIMSLAASLCTLTIIYISHTYSLQPSTFLSVYFSVTVLFDFLMARSYFLRIGFGLLGLLQLFVVLVKVALVALEETPKRGLFFAEKLQIHASPEEVSGFWSRAFFLWLQPTLFLCFNEAVSIDALPNIDDDLDPKKLYSIFWQYWTQVDKRSQLALLTSLMYTIPSQFVSAIFPRLLHVMCNFLLPFLVLYVVDYVTRSMFDRDTAYNLIGATAIIFPGYSITRTMYGHLTYRILTSIRGILMVAIHQKVQKLDLDVLEQSTAVALTNADTNSAEQIITLAFDSWASFLQVSMGLFALSNFVGWACLFMLVPGLISFAASILVGKQMSRAAMAWNEQKQARISATSNVLAQLKNIKAMGLSEVLASHLAQKRAEEIETSMQDRYGRLWMFAFSAFNATLTPAMVLAGAYYWTRFADELRVAEVFAIVAITTSASEPLIGLLEGVMQWSEEFASIIRIHEFLVLPETEEQREWDLTPPQSPNSFRAAQNPNSLQQAPHASFAVQMIMMSVTSLVLGPVLRDIDLRIPWGALLILWGPIGCGKSTFLKTIIGEVILNTGSVILGSKSVAYCSQQCWVQNLTIRANVTGALEYIEDWYREVIFCCALDLDFMQLPNGDLAIAGSRGCNLSGGQKQRICLARAVYSRQSIIVLDDIFSSLDPATASLIFDRLFGSQGLVRQWNCTVIMTTNRLEFLDHATMALEMLPDGRVRLSTSSENSSRAGTPAASSVESAAGSSAGDGAVAARGSALGSAVSHADSGPASPTSAWNQSGNPFAGIGSGSSSSNGTRNTPRHHFAGPSAGNPSGNPFAGIGSGSSSSNGTRNTPRHHFAGPSAGNSSGNPFAGISSGGFTANGTGNTPRHTFAGPSAWNPSGNPFAGIGSGGVRGSTASSVSGSIASGRTSAFDEEEEAFSTSSGRSIDNDSDDTSDDSTEPGTADELPHTETQLIEPPSVKALEAEESELCEAKEQRRHGDVTLYTFFLRSAGFLAVTFWIFAAAVSAVAEKMPIIFIHIWYSNDRNDRRYFFGYLAFAVANVILITASGAYYFAFIVPKTSMHIHWQLLQVVMGATAEFLNHTDSGDLLNRFSRDISMVSNKLPIVFMQAVFMTFTVLTEIAIISYGSPYITPIVIFLVVVICLLQNFYLRTSRQLRILELESNASLITHLMETASGIAHIRAFGWQPFFTGQLHYLLMRSQKPFYLIFCSEQWLTLALDLTSSMAAVFLVIFTTFWPDSTSDSAVGLALLCLLTFSTTASFMVRSWSHTETSLGSVSRIRAFCLETPQEVDTLSGPELPSDWPSSGRIDFNGLNVSYRTNDGATHQALQQVTTTIYPGHKVGIEGRSGSGKSTMLQAIVRLMEFSGSISIDGRNIKTIPREILRNRITVLTQDGVELQGTVRLNLYPFQGAQPDVPLMTSILTQVGLWDHIVARGGIEANIVSMRFSVGQKQLLFLARAILHQRMMNTTVVLVDEATSSMDYQVDDSAQQLMDQAFIDCTVLLISHRPDAFDNADAIIGLDGGTVTGVQRRGRLGEWIWGQ